VSFARLVVRGLLFNLGPALLAAQLPTAVVAGRVSARADSAASTPLGDATVSIVGTTLGVTTGADVRFTLERVPPGAVTVRVRLLGYRTVDRAVRVRAGDTVRVDVVLQTDAQLLSGVRTDARRADAELFLTRPNIATITMNAAAMAGVPSVGEPDVIRLGAASTRRRGT
jgi:hypothetical protein